VQLSAVGRRGLFTAEDFLAACKPRGHMIYPPSTRRHDRAWLARLEQHSRHTECAS